MDALVAAVLLSGCTGRCSGRADAPVSSPFLGPAIVVATAEQRRDQGFQYGYSDGTLGAVRSDLQVVFFASGRSNARCDGTPDTQGVYRLFSDASNRSTITAPCTAVLRRQEGSAPDGSALGAFDRDYLGGGPALRVTSEDGRQTGILLVYHAEFHWGPSCGPPCFYGTLGLAFSSDEGRTFRKLGEIVQPTISRQEWIETHPHESLPIGSGPLVLGNDAARAVDPSTMDASRDYLYLFYVDRDPASACGDVPCLTLARARLDDVLDAAFAGHATEVGKLFRKLRDSRFDEPATSGHPDDAKRSGRFSPILRNAFMPSALYDRPMGKVLLATIRSRAVQIRASANLLEWPDAPLVTLDEQPEREIRYPSLVGDMPDPAVGGKAPLLFFTDEPPGGNWSQSTLKVGRLHL